MQTIQMRALRAATGGGSEPPNCRSQIAKCRLRALRMATGGGRETSTEANEGNEGDWGTWEPQLINSKWESNGEMFAYVRVCSRMFAYVRLMGEKMLRALREATGGGQEGRRKNAECRMKSRPLRAAIGIAKCTK